MREKLREGEEEEEFSNQRKKKKKEINLDYWCKT